MSRIKLVALDLDGTLLGRDSTVASEERDAIVRAAKEKEIQFVICTGRNYVEAEPFAHSAGGVSWVITENGAQLRQLSDGKPVLSQPMTTEQCQFLLELCQEHDTEPSLYTQNRVYYGDACVNFLEEFRKIHPVSIPPTSRQQYSYVESAKTWRFLVQHETIFKAIIYGDSAKVQALTEALRDSQELEAEPSVLLGGALRNVEINRKGVTKGHALQVLAERLHLKRDEIMAFGDSDNDNSMLEYAGVSVAMGNAPAHMKAAADIVAPTNAEHGVAAVIEQYLLRDKENT